jgi:hypothetical protein
VAVPHQSFLLEVMLHRAVPVLARPVKAAVLGDVDHKERNTTNGGEQRMSSVSRYIGALSATE